MGNKHPIQVDTFPDHHDTIEPIQCHMRRWFDFRVPAYTRVSWRHLMTFDRYKKCQSGPQVRLKKPRDLSAQDLPSCLSEFYAGDQDIQLEINYYLPPPRPPQLLVVHS